MLFTQNTDMSSSSRRTGNQGKPRTRGRVRRRVSRVLNPVAATAAVLYFLIDAVFLSAVRTIIRPVARALSRLRIFNALAAWLASLGPYPTLVLFLVPVIILEPVKPVGAYLIATGHLVSGISLIVIGEVLKIVIVERLFHFSRDKLMTIPAFARVYSWAEAWLEYFRSQPLWQATLRQLTAIKALAGRILKRSKAWIILNARSHLRE
jgi:uncharacterized membrane protein